MREDENDKQEFKEFANKSDINRFLTVLDIPYRVGEFIWVESRRILREKKYTETNELAKKCCGFKEE